MSAVAKIDRCGLDHRFQAAIVELLARSTLKTSAWAFRSRRRERPDRGRRRMASVFSARLLHNQHSRRGADERERCCFSIYSLIIDRVIALITIEQETQPSAFVSSVFPTPVGPRNRRAESGRCGSRSPARARRNIASDTASTALSWPTTAAAPAMSPFPEFCLRSPSSIFSTGYRVQRDTTQRCFEVHGFRVHHVNITVFRSVSLSFESLGNFDMLQTDRRFHSRPGAQLSCNFRAGLL